VSQSETARNNLHSMDSTEWWRVPSTDPLARILDVFEGVIISVGGKQRIVPV
jgi:hypothetical protein